MPAPTRLALAAALIAAGTTLSGCTSAPSPIWDSHVHLNDAEMQVRLMDEYGIARAVVFWGRNSDHDTIVEAAARHPGRFIPFASLSPERSALRVRWQRDDPAILERLEELLATGHFKGIGEISVAHAATPGFAATDFSPVGPTMSGIMALARKHHVPVMVHCELHRMEELSKMLEAYRGVPVIWAHGGYSDAATARAMLAAHPNLFYELSARTWPRHPRSADYPIVDPEGALRADWRELVESMPARFLVGTDASHHSEANERMKAGSVRNFLSQLSPAARRAIARENLGKLLGER